MGTLQSALSWARRGFPVFPLREYGKEPVHDAWQTIATTDEATIIRLWTDPVLRTERDYNIGTLCTDMVVVDIDVKEGKDGYNEYAQLGGHYDTLVVQTPTGGFHCYFNAPDSSNAPISRSIDIRSHNGYVVAPGSRIPGYGTEEYTVINDRERAWVPESIRGLLRPPYVRQDFEIDFSVDSQASIAAAINFLSSAPVAVEGQRGDETTFVTAARLVREMGLSAATAFCLMRDHWNERCMPPWTLDELARKVENAVNYGTAGSGRLTAEFLFEGVIVPPQQTVFEQSGSLWGNALEPSRVRPRPWLYDRMLMREAVTVLMAAGSAGKSSISLALAAHAALGLDFAGYKCLKPCKTIVYNGEDDLEEQSRRLQAVCIAYGFDYQQVKQNLMLLSNKQVRFDLVALDFRRPVRNEELVKQIIHEASDPEVGLLILDPLVKIHKCDESDNVHMDYVMETLTDIAAAANVSVLALHHTSKGGRNEDRIGNMDISRGASAIVNAARVAFTLLNASAQDAEDYGLQDEERGMWVRLDDAKMNLSLASNEATWFRKEGVRIPSLDVVGVLHHEPLEKSHQHIRIRIAERLLHTMVATGAGSITLPRAAAILKEQEPLWANKQEAEIKRRIEGMYATPIEVGEKTLVVERSKSDKTNKEEIMVIMR